MRIFISPKNGEYVRVLTVIFNADPDPSLESKRKLDPDQQKQI